MKGIVELRYREGLGRSDVEFILSASNGFIGCVEPQESRTKPQGVKRQSCLYGVGLDIAARPTASTRGDFAAA